ncbi:hypothetical protein N3K66_007632 [Trichothecium roseum]|uniref:Uncharacterized protein n=1 Tax=Trichothecium roseum TaxID=47278 RepID=A0ACC0UUJ6_9HYPO|nr:hypothetical protein N3K66_007632 [Trichothecium roseum]
MPFPWLLLLCFVLRRVRWLLSESSKVDTKAGVQGLWVSQPCKHLIELHYMLYCWENMATHSLPSTPYGVPIKISCKQIGLVNRHTDSGAARPRSRHLTDDWQLKRGNIIGRLDPRRTDPDDRKGMRILLPITLAGEKLLLAQSWSSADDPTGTLDGSNNE